MRPSTRVQLPYRIVAVFLALVLGACAYPIRTKYDVDPTADFAQYRTFAWVPGDPNLPASGVRHGGYVSALDEQRIVRAVDAELAAKGYSRAEEFASADLAVTFAIGVEEKRRVNEYSGGTVRRTIDYGYGSWYTNSQVVIHTHEEGTLRLEFYDLATKQAVWVGWAQKRLERQDDSETIIRAAISAMMAHFPERT